MGMSNRTRQMLTATLQGLPLMETIDDFDPPKIEFDMEEMRGGRFLPEEMIKGLKTLGSKVTINGVGMPIMLAIGVTIGEDILLQVREAGKDQDGNTYFTYHTIGGPLKSLEEKTLKMGDKPVTVIEISPRTYSRIENGITVIDIDARTQVLIVNGVDFMADVRAAALMV